MGNSAISVAVAGIIFFVPLVFGDHIEHEDGESTCLTPGCLDTTSRILKNLNPTINPCDNFYEFTCGGSDESVTTLEEPGVNPRKSKRVEIAKILFNTCMNTTSIEESGLIPILLSFSVAGGWPVLEGDNWNESTFDWAETIDKLRDVGHTANYLINMTVNVNLINRTKHIIEVNQASLGIPRCHLISGPTDKIFDAYYKFMIDVAVMLGADKERATRELWESLRFEQKLALISTPWEQQTSPEDTWHPMSILEMNMRYNFIDWKKYINDMLPSDLSVDYSEIVNVGSPRFIDNLGKILAETPKRVQANYIMWRVAEISSSFLNKEMSDRRFEYVRTYFDYELKRSPRIEECVNLVNEFLPVYDNNRFINYNKNGVSEMIDDIQKQFSEILAKKEDLDECTRAKTLDEVVSVAQKIRFAASLHDQNDSDDTYDNLSLNPTFFFANIRSSTIFWFNRMIEKLRKPVLETTPVNEITATSRSSISKMLFSDDSPRYVKYGVLGSLIGYTMKQNSENDSESQTVTEEDFIHAAYLAYKEWALKNGPEPKLPNFDYTSVKTFWISVMNIRCSKYQSEVPHLLEKIPEFSNDFDCSVLNSARRCAG